jgi:predicted Zn-ribbon and HTH transcriptional regulator
VRKSLTEKLERLELARRIRDRDFDFASLRNPNVIPPDPEAVAAVMEHRRAQRRADQQILDPAPEPAACEKHGWGFRDGVRARPPASACPECLNERLAGRNPKDSEADVQRVVRVAHPQYREGSESGERLWGLHLDKRRQAGELLPGSHAELVALERIADLRSEEEDRSRPRVPAFVSFSPLNGDVAIYRRPWRR